MILEALCVALEARSSLKEILKRAQVAKINLFGSDLDDTCYTETFNQINIVIAETEKAIANIDAEYQKAIGVLS